MLRKMVYHNDFTFSVRFALSGISCGSHIAFLYVLEIFLNPLIGLICEKYKKRNKGRHDVLVPYSGGKDGAYIAYNLKEFCNQEDLLKNTKESKVRKETLL